MHEEGAVRKDPGGKLNIALVYPNAYRVGMSNLGVHAMYSAFNSLEGIVCERFFTDYLRSVESSRPLDSFHIIAFSVSYELDWINVFKILALSKIPLRSSERKGFPLIMAGGAAVTLNPEPAADALDICFLGDGENAADTLYEAFKKAVSKEGFLSALEVRAGFYIPQLYDRSGIKPELSVISPLDEPSSTIIRTDETVFNDMFLVEIARGCPFSCKFCAAKSIYSPFRAVKAEMLIPAFEKASLSGLKLGLVSTSLNNHPQAGEIFSIIDDMGLNIAPPSLRLGRITPEFVSLLESSHVKGVTLAPETGSESLRKACGKAISDETFINDIKMLVSGGILDIKLYFIIGLPGETTSDIESIIELAARTRQCFVDASRQNRRLGNIQLSVNLFVPKPLTEFERHPMIDLKQAKKRFKKIDDGLKHLSNIRVSHESPKRAYLQSAISRGGRREFELLEKLSACPESSWKNVLDEWGASSEYDLCGSLSNVKELPWAFLKR